MRKRIIIGILVSTAIFLGCFFFIRASKKSTADDRNVKKPYPSQISDTSRADQSFHSDSTSDQPYTPSKKDTIPVTWKSYHHKQLRLSFRYPDTWKIFGTESNVTDRNGQVMGISINLIDTVSNSTFHLEYHLPPYGRELYMFIKQQSDSLMKCGKDIRYIEVAGMNAIESATVMKSDIKGNQYDPPLTLVNIDFLNRSNDGSYSISFRTLVTKQNPERLKFNQLLSTIKFTN